LSSLYSKFKTSDKLEAEGINLDLGFCVITVARAGGNNQPYNAAMERLYKQHKRAIANDLLDNAKSRDLVYAVYAEHVVRDWKTRVGGTDDAPKYETGIEGPDGKIMPFNRDNVIATFKALPDLFAEIREAAESLQYFRQSLLDGAVKN